MIHEQGHRSLHKAIVEKSVRAQGKPQEKAKIKVEYWKGTEEKRKDMREKTEKEVEGIWAWFRGEAARGVIRLG